MSSYLDPQFFECSACQLGAGFILDYNSEPFYTYLFVRLQIRR